MHVVSGAGAGAKPAAFQHADYCCPQGLLRASRSFLRNGRMQTLGVNTNCCMTPDVYRLLEGTAAVLPHLVSLSMWSGTYETFFLPPPPGLAQQWGEEPDGQSAEPPIPLFAPLLRLSSLTRLSWTFFDDISACALQAAIGTAARIVAPLISLSLSCDEAVVVADGEDPFLDLTPLASLRHLEKLNMEACPRIGRALGEPPTRAMPRRS